MTSNQTPLITIGLPVYNSERHIENSIESLLNQSYRDFLLIISDNASTDQTSDICQEYAKLDKRIIYHRNPNNIGLSPNFNFVFKQSKSPYFKWATADDFWAPTMLEKALGVMESDEQVALCYPKTMLVDESGNNPQPYEDNLNLMSDNPRERFIQFLENGRLTHQHLGVSRASMIRKTHMLAEHGGSDINFLAELALYGKFYEYPERLFFRRFHKDSSSWARNDSNHQKRRYHSKKSAGIVLTRWRQYISFFRAIHASPIAIREKIALDRYIALHMRWDRYPLAKELVAKTGIHL
jgi:glycosyltransferase involved in cell wall biosynthesis